jgi:hypothetical protein
LSQQKAPLLFQYLAQHNLKAAITVVHDSKNTAEPENILPSWLTNLMSDVQYASSISPLLINIEHQTESPKVQIFYFSDASEYQFEIFVDALLLNQRTKPTQDILWVSSLGNTNNNSAFGVKPSVLIWPDKPNKSLSYLTSQMDLQPTLISEALGCSISEVTYSTGKNLFKVKKDRIIANSMVNGLMVFNKDKTIFIDQNGNFQSYSIQLQTPIIEKADFPLLIDGVKYIKRYGSETLNEQ